MSTTPRDLFAALMVAIVVLGPADAGDRPLGPKALAAIQEATGDLVREVEYLQDLMVEQNGEKERTLFRQADAVLADIAGFQKSLKPESSRARLDKAFNELDRKIHEFLKAVQAFGPEQRLLQLSAARVSVADEELHYALSAPDSSARRAKQVLERQTQTLVIAARRLDKTAEYTLGTVQGQNILVGDLHQLAEAAELFQKGVASGMNRAQLRKEFVAVNQAWEQAIRGLGKLEAGQNMRLFRAGGQLDRLHERLYRLLGIEGERPQLIMRT